MASDELKLKYAGCGILFFAVLIFGTFFAGALCSYIAFTKTGIPEAGPPGWMLLALAAEVASGVLTFLTAATIEVWRS